MKTTLAAWLWVMVAIASGQSLSLESALKSARQNRPAVEAARLDFSHAQKSAQALGAYPATRFGVGVSSVKDLGATDEDLFVTQPLDIFGRTSANRRVGQMSVAVAEAARREALLGVQSQVLHAYLEATAAQRQSQVARELQALAASLQQATKRRVEEGKAPEIQLTRAAIEFERAQQSARSKDALLAAALKRLSAAISSQESPGELDGELLLTAPVSEIAARPDLMALQAQVRQAKAEAGAARKTGLPELDLTGLRSPWGDSSSRFAVRLQLNFPLYDHRRAKAEADAAERLADAYQARFEDERLKALKELEAIDLEIGAARDQMASYESIKLSTRDLLARSQKGYSEGFGTLLDVLEASRALREVEQELIEARLGFNLAVAAKVQATGTFLEGFK